MSENTIAKGLRWAAARGSANADNDGYFCPVTIREANLAADEIDALAATVAEQAALIESLQNRWASRPLSVEDTAALEAENDRLAARVAELEAALRRAGKHPEECVADDPGPCASHMAYMEISQELGTFARRLADMQVDLPPDMNKILHENIRDLYWRLPDADGGDANG